METLKVKSALFSLLAFLTLSILMTSCEYDIVERLDTTDFINQPIIPITTALANDDAMFRTILNASKGKLELDPSTGQYHINLTYNDLGAKIHRAINKKDALNISKNFIIPASDVADIFCLAENQCLFEGDFRVRRTEISLNRPVGSRDVYFKVSQILIYIL